MTSKLHFCFQEHVVHFVVKLLSPPIPSTISEFGSHLFGYMSMLNSILFGACCIDVVHIVEIGENVMCSIPQPLPCIPLYM